MVASNIVEVDKLELRYKRKVKAAVEAKAQVKEEQLTDQEVKAIKKRILKETMGEVVAGTVAIDVNPGELPEQVPLLELPHSYNIIRNLLWIDSKPVYKEALNEWKSNLAVFTSKVERKTTRIGNLKNEIYNLIGFDSVFQGVLLTASAQTQKLRCRNHVLLLIALSVCVSIVALFGIWQKLSQIQNLETIIHSEEGFAKEASAKIEALKEKGESFRFNDFLESKRVDKPHSVCGLSSQKILAIEMGKKTKFVNKTDKVVKLKEGSHSTHTFMCEIAAGKEHDLPLHSKGVIHREYHIYADGISTSATQIMVDLDDCREFKTITISAGSKGFEWAGTERKKKSLFSFS